MPPPENTTSTQNIFTQTRLPAWIQPYYEALAQGAMDESAQAYRPYEGARLAGFTGLENAAMQGIGALGMSGGPLQQQYATQGVQGAMGGLSSLGSQIGGYTNNFMDVYGRAGNPMMTTGADWSSYMQPYTQNVTNIAEREARRFGDVQRSELGSRAAAAGAFGGYRHGLGEQAIDRNTAQMASDIRVQGLEKAFDRGLGMFESDRAAQMGGIGQQMGALQGGLGGLQTGANIFGNQGNLGGIMGGLGAQEQAMQYERLGNMEAAGTRQRALQQAGLDVGYQDFVNQRNYPRENMSWFSSILNGLPYDNMRNTTQSMGQTQPGLFQGMLGAGIGGLGLYSAIGGFGNQQ